MKRIKFVDILPFLFLGLIALLPLIGVLTELTAFADPAAYNYRIEHLAPGEAVDGYLKTTENYLSLVASILLLVFIVVFIIFKALKKNNTFIELIEAGNGLFLLYSLVRAVYCYSVGSTSITVGLFYTGAAIGSAFMMVQFPKRAQDGDCLTPYYVGAIATIGLFVFGSATSNSYSLLNAYAHLGDVVYWAGYLSSRGFVLLFAFLVYANLNFNCDPSLILNEYQESQK